MRVDDNCVVAQALAMHRSLKLPVLFLSVIPATPQSVRDKDRIQHLSLYQRDLLAETGFPLLIFQARMEQDSMSVLSQWTRLVKSHCVLTALPNHALAFSKLQALGRAIACPLYALDTDLESHAELAQLQGWVEEEALELSKCDPRVQAPLFLKGMQTNVCFVPERVDKRWKTYKGVVDHNYRVPRDKRARVHAGLERTADKDRDALLSRLWRKTKYVDDQVWLDLKKGLPRSQAVSQHRTFPGDCEAGKTHDAEWNKIHQHLRARGFFLDAASSKVWFLRLLEWTKDPLQGVELAMSLFERFTYGSVQQGVYELMRAVVGEESMLELKEDGGDTEGDSGEGKEGILKKKKK